MPKKQPPSTSAGTATPAHQPAAPPATPTTGAAPAGQAPVKGKTTAGSAPKPPATPQAQALETEADFERSAIELLTESVTGADDEAAIPAARSAAETPVEQTVTAEETVTGEEAAASQLTGTPEKETQSPHTEAEPGPTAGADDDDDEDLDDAALEAKAREKNWPASYLRRMKRERRKTRRLEERLDELEALREENEQLKTKAAADAPAPVAVTNAELSLTGEIEHLRHKSSKIREAIRIASVNGVERVTVQFDGADKPIEVSIGEAENALEILADKVSDKKDDLRAQRREREGLRERFDTAVAERHPWMADKKNPARARVEEIIRRYPALQHIAEARFWIAGALAFDAMMARQAQANGNAGAVAGAGEKGRKGAGENSSSPPGSPAPVPPRPAGRTTRPAASPMAVNGQRATLQAQEKTFLESGDPEAGKALLTAILSD
jgi:hypothetical protein